MEGQFSKEKAHFYIARIKKGGKDFEIDVDPDIALAYKAGKAEIKDVLKAEHIFADLKKGMVASEKEMETLFGTSDVFEVAKIILEKGELPITAEHKRAMVEEKRKQIIHIIHTNAVDPKTHLPHPAQRIEAAMEEAKVRIDDFKSANEQIDEVLKKIRVVLPIKFEVKEIAAKIPAAYAPKSYPVLKSFGKLLREEWLRDGSLAVLVEMPGGLEEEFHQKLNALCHGEVETKIFKVK